MRIPANLVLETAETAPPGAGICLDYNTELYRSFRAFGS